MCANISFHFDTSSATSLESHQTGSATDDNFFNSLLYPDTLSASDSLSPCSVYSSLSGDEGSICGKRHRQYDNFPISTKRFRGVSCNSHDEVILPRSPESGISLSPPMAVYLQNPQVHIEILDEPELYYRARYASEGSRGPLKGRLQNSYPKVKVVLMGNSEHASATVSVSLVNEDLTPHDVCSLATTEEDGTSNTVKKATGADLIFEFDQLRVKKEKHNVGGSKGRQKPKSHKHNESVGYLLFQAEITTFNGKNVCYQKSSAINLIPKPESAELHAIKNEHGSVDGGDEVWIRGSKMIGNPSVLFMITDPASNQVKTYQGALVREECHQNLLVVTTPKVPFKEQVTSHVYVVTGKDKRKSNCLQFTFMPSLANAANVLPVAYTKPPASPMAATLDTISHYSRLSPSYSPQPATPSSSVWFTADDLPFLPSSPPANGLEVILDVCVQQLDRDAEEKILLTATLPTTPIAMQ